MTHNPPNLRRLVMFDAVMRSGSTGAAARHLGLSQPAVSDALSKLETETGTRLLDRGSGGSIGTPAGRLLHRRVARMLRQIEQGIAHVGEGHGIAIDTRAVTRLLTTTQVRYHIAIAEFGSFRAAARHLGIAEPTLHRTARDFESGLKVPLYRRHLRGMAATELGAHLAATLRVALREIDQALAEIANARGLSEGRIAFGCLPMMPKQLLARAIGRMLRLHPGIEIEMEEGSHEYLMATLRNGTADFVIGALRGEGVAPDLVETALFEDPYVVVARTGHRLARASRVKDMDLARQHWVIPPRSMPRYAALQALFARFPKRPNAVLETSSLAMMTSALAESDCLSVLARSQAFTNEFNASIAVLPVELPSPQRFVGTTTRAGWLPTRIQRRFLTLIRRECRTVDAAV
ncbi:MAG TPA: LysR family transcriptional regulator [Stellaceae bacterium]|jgi:DNA-binding transcriptional LysR family regulator|nr:LysR family transcriptional regulator [Stellaceae bacterium]